VKIRQKKFKAGGNDRRLSLRGVLGFYPQNNATSLQMVYEIITQAYNDNINMFLSGIAIAHVSGDLTLRTTSFYGELNLRNAGPSALPVNISYSIMSTIDSAVVAAT